MASRIIRACTALLSQSFVARVARSNPPPAAAPAFAAVPTQTLLCFGDGIELGANNFLTYDLSAALSLPPLPTPDGRGHVIADIHVIEADARLLIFVEGRRSMDRCSISPAAC